MKKRNLILFLILIGVLSAQNIQWNQLATGSRHGTDSKGQSSDGTGTSGNFPKYNSDGGITDSGISSASLTIPSNCAVVGSNSSPTLVCQSFSGIVSVSYAAGGGTANAQTVSLSPAPASLAVIKGYPFCWFPNEANTSTTPTLNVNSFGSETIVKQAGGVLAANDILTTALACAVWDGTNFELQNPQTGNNGNATSINGGSVPASEGVVGTNSSSQIVASTAANIYGLFSGTCSSTTYLSGSGACSTPSGSGTVTNIATTSPITGGTITSTGTIACSTCTIDVCSGTITPSGTLTSASQGSLGSATCTGAASSDKVQCSFNGNPFTVTGFLPSTSGILTLACVASTNTVTLYGENNTGSSFTIGSTVINFGITR